MQDLGIRVLFMGNNFIRLLGGLWVTIRLSLVSILLSVLLGILLGVVMTFKNPVTKCLSRVYLEFIRIMPQLVLLFLVYFGATKAFGLNLSGETSAVIVFTLWGTAEMGDLVRGALISIPKHQYESGAALGMENAQIYRYIIIPQTDPAVDQSCYANDKDNVPDRYDRCGGSVEGWTADHRGEPIYRAGFSTLDLCDDIFYVFSGMLAGFHAGWKA